MPRLPYAMEALAPRMSRETLEYHYGKHLQGYVDNLNRLAEGTPHAAQSLEEIVRTAEGALFDNAAQAWNHAFFFSGLTPAQEPMPQRVAERLARDFGSAEAFRERFAAAATGLFGSGWVWLVSDREGRLAVTAKSNAGNPLTDGLRPLLAVDVWEHSYYIDYRNRRADYLKAFWELVDWNRVDGLLFPAEYLCTACDYVYDPAKGDPENGIAPGTPFEELPGEWSCPLCGLGREAFGKR